MDGACEGGISWESAGERNKAMNKIQGSISVCGICEDKIETRREGHDKFDTQLRMIVNPSDQASYKFNF